MNGEHRYALHSRWTGNRGTGTSGYRDYDRSVTISVDGKPALDASSDRPFRGDPAKWNPEDLLLAALSECHLLSYLHACVQAGVVVVSYEDSATGLMTEDGRGGGSFTEVTLHPRVEVAAASMVAAAEAAHAQAREWCFIANSVNFPVRHEAVVVVAGVSDARAGVSDARGEGPA
ncbi:MULTISPECIES: OsmC family protein [Microbacterium]|uniref:Peroxiredoxin n=1 Tax=Microbacterium hominis TaxID=162426 RepID=A0A2K9DDR0_9MICO|nr:MULTISPECIES: OsmC family protein [Microbacterium]AUG30271.1 peroxiredoxin [Microbacterium hominis]